MHQSFYHPNLGTGEINSCSFCGKSFNSKALCKKHEKRHDEKHTCEICGKSYTSSPPLKEHIMIVHPGQKNNFKRDKCGKLFGRKGNLKTHEMRCSETEEERKKQIETNLLLNDKSVECEECGKAFRDIHKLREHKYKHGEPQFPCHVCGQKFQDPMSVKDHYKYVHENMRFTCEVCGRQFRNQTNLKRRNKTFHETSSE